MSTEREIAYHEAGHAVVGYLLGETITKMTINRNGDKLGEIFWSRNAGGDIGAQKLFAGDIAERILRQDKNIIYDNTKWTCESKWALSSVEGDERELYRDTRDRLIANWRAVEELERVLEEKKELQGEEAMAILNKTLGGPVDKTR